MKNILTITRCSALSGKENTMILNCSLAQYSEGLMEYEGGVLLQDAFHFLKPEQREFIKTGITPEEWDLL